MRKVTGFGIAVVVLLLVLLGLASRRPREEGWVTERLGACPKSPNCVSSRDARPSFRVEPLAVDGPPEAAFHRATEVVRALPRTRIVTEEPGYLHAECASALFRFVDDLELELEVDADSGSGVIHVRSASRIGHTDLGANRRRVERIRAALSPSSTGRGTG